MTTTPCRPSQFHDNAVREGISDALNNEGGATDLLQWNNLWLNGDPTDTARPRATSTATA